MGPMKISGIIHGWLAGLNQNSGEQVQPAFLPVTVEEAEEVKRNAVFYTPSCDTFDPGAPTKIYGMPLHQTHYAVEQRARQLTVPFLHLGETSGLSLEYSVRECVERMRLHFNARVCAETTQLKATFEWDRWASVKRFLRIVKWFPIKTRTVLIDGRVLYPFLKVGLPHNRHYTQFKIA